MYYLFNINMIVNLIIHLKIHKSYPINKLKDYLHVFHHQLINIRNTFLIIILI